MEQKVIQPNCKVGAFFLCLVAFVIFIARHLDHDKPCSSFTMMYMSFIVRYCKLIFFAEKFYVRYIVSS